MAVVEFNPERGWRAVLLVTHATSDFDRVCEQGPGRKLPRRSNAVPFGL